MSLLRPTVARPKRERGTGGLGRFAVGLAVVLCVATACGGSSSSNPKVRIAFVAPTGNTFSEAEYKGLKDYAEAHNAIVDWVDTGFDAQREYAAIQNITVTKKYQGIIVLPLDAVGVIPSIDAAVKAGIQVVALNNPLGPDLNSGAVQVPGVAGVVITPQYQRGIWIGQGVVAACGTTNPCKFALLAGVIGISAEKAIHDGVLKGIEGHPNVILARWAEAGDYTPDKGLTAGQNLLTAIPDLKLITASGDQMVRGVEQAVIRANKVGKVILGSLGASDYGVAAVKDGRWNFVVVTLPINQGTESARILLAHIADPKLPPEAAPEVPAGMNPILTKENIGDFKAQWAT
jgi:ribose transport system substrate-binding protein